MSEPMRAEGREFRSEDWYADELGAARFTDCTFTDVDLSEVTTSGAMFEGCTFAGCRLNSSVHRATAFVACEFGRSNFFDATLEGCKLSGRCSPSARCGRSP